MRVNGITSYYVYSGVEGDYEAKLPVIIFVGHPLLSPTKRLLAFKDEFDEPVLLIWSGLLSDLREECLVDDHTVWARKRQEFVRLLDNYRERFNLDTNRIYLTGFSFSAVYAWMLAYDRPELYAGVVPMSAVSYPAQIQQHLDAAKTVITVVVRGKEDPGFAGRQELETGRTIESYNRHSKFILKEAEGHSEVGKYWLEYLKYALSFSKTDVVQHDDTLRQGSKEERCYRSSGTRIGTPAKRGLLGDSLWCLVFGFLILLFGRKASPSRRGHGIWPGGVAAIGRRSDLRATSSHGQKLGKA
jgi:pimeloyl-ACP methyl ester carboxylesterase